MKRYDNLGDLLIDYRNLNKMSQLDLASLLEVDTRTISRWENNDTLVKPEKEKVLTRKLNIPFQVVRNLNSEYPLSIYYDPQLRNYSLSSVFKKADAEWFKSDFSVDDERIQLLNNKSDIEFLNSIREMRKTQAQVNPDVIKRASEILPDLNIVLYDQTGFYAGHLSILPLKYDTYTQLREKEIDEESITIDDLNTNFNDVPLVLYYYSIYADSIDDAYYIINCLLEYFKLNKFKNYIFAGISIPSIQIQTLKDMGLKVLWTDHAEDGNTGGSFMEGNFDMFLFGKMN